MNDEWELPKHWMQARLPHWMTAASSSSNSSNPQVQEQLRSGLLQVQMVQQEAVAQMKEEEQEEEVQKLQKVLLAQMLANDEVPEAGLSAKQEEPEQQVGAASPMSPTEEPEEPKQQVRFASPVSPPDMPVASPTSPAD